MPGPRFVAGERISLRPVEEEDHDFLQRWWNHPEIRPGFGGAQLLSASDNADRIEHVADADETEIFLITSEGENDAAEDGSEDAAGGAVERVGEAFLFDLKPDRGSVELGYWIAPPHQGNGFATETAELLVDYCFGHRRLHKVNARVLAFNDGSRRVLEKAGFEHEGRRREDFYVDGTYVDADLYGLVAGEWRGGG